MGLSRFIVSCCLLIVGFSAVAQPTQLGTQTVNGAYASYGLTDLGIFRQARVQATSSAGAGTRNWEFYEAAFDYDPAWRPYTAGITLSSYDQTVPPVGGTASALFNTGFGGSAGLMPDVTSGRYYTFNVTEYSTPGVPANEYMGVLETSYNPVSITSVTQTPAAGAVYPEGSVYVTITTSAAPAAGEYVYLRYSTTFNFLTSTLLTVSMTGTTGVVEIPCQSAGTTIYYYAYTSNRTSGDILADAGTYGQVAHDMSTLSLNNNGGPNFTYTVLASIGFCGDYYVPSVCYPTIASFVTAINAGTVSCDVTCYVAAGHTETAPAGGINLTQTGTAANTITFIRNGVGANPIVYAPVGVNSITAASTSSDGVFSLNGSDYITIDGIDIIDNNVSGADMMEYGYALFKASATDGCQNNIIRNCSITLNQDNHWTGTPLNFEFGSTGIMLRNTTRTALTTLLTITTAAGRSDNNQFYGNTISDMINGFVIAGYNDVTSPYSYYDQGNLVGIPGSGNVIQQFGNDNTVGISRASGVYAIYQNNIEVSDNMITSSVAGLEPHANVLYGVFVSSPISGSYGQNLYIENNQISLTRSEGSSPMTAIKVGNSTAAANYIEIVNNTIQNCTFYNDPGTVASPTGNFYGMDIGFNASALLISGNIIQDNILNTATLSASYLIYNNTNGSDIDVSNNTMTNNFKTLTSSGSLYGYYSASTTATGTTIFNNNVIDGLSVTSTSNAFAVGARITSSVNQVKTIENNTILNIAGGNYTGTAAYTAGINVDGMPAGSTVSNNLVEGVSSASYVFGIACTNPSNMSGSLNVGFTASGNTISNISTTGATHYVVGLAMHTVTSGGGDIISENNIIEDISTTGVTSVILRMVSLQGGSSGASYVFRGNQISNGVQFSATSTGITTGLYCIVSSSTCEVSGNHLTDITSNSVNAQVNGIYLVATSEISVFNNFIQRLTTPATQSLIGIIGINIQSSVGLHNIYYNTIALGYESPLSSTGTGFGFTGVSYYGLNTSVLDLRNNIIYINGTCTGDGTGACIRRSGGVAYTQPSNFLSSNNNYYYINNALRNYIYTEAFSSTTNVNGYAYGGAFTDVARNLNNDECFNIVGAGTGLYKTFMAPAESNSFFDVPPFAGGAVYPYNLKLIPGAVAYAESNAQVIAGITTDYEGDARSGTTPDIGADEGPFLPQVEDCYLLPLELLSFTGWNSGNFNELHWVTANEFNTSHFEVERSADGVSFDVIGIVDAAGYSVTTLDYHMIDDAPFTGNNYYHLRMVDNDGAYSYSNTILITLQGDASSVLQVTPNPATDHLHINLQLPVSGEVVLSLTDMLGRKVIANELSLEKGLHVLDMDISMLPASTYMLTLSDATGIIEAVKILKH